MKFKAGDKVRVIYERCRSFHPTNACKCLGRIGTIKEINYNGREGCYFVYPFEGYNYGCSAFTENDLELVESYKRFSNYEEFKKWNES